MATPNIACMPAEIHDIIFESIEFKDALSLSYCCKTLFVRMVPLIYENVNLSTHNRERVETTSATGGGTRWADVRPIQSPPAAMIRRQHSFLLSLSRDPERGKYVRNFTWTLVFASDLNGDGISLPANEVLQYPETKIWDAFWSMVNVEKLDFASLHGYYAPYLLQCPSRLFSSAVSVRLLGRFSFRLASAILHSVDATKLEYLSLDDVQDWGQHADGMPISLSEAYNLDGRMEDKNPHGGRGLVFPGPMRGLLPLLEGQCLSLTSLFLRRPAETENRSRVKFWSSAADEEVYSEWAAFIESVKPTIQYLGIEHGRDVTIGRSMAFRTESHPIETHFGNHVYPTLVKGPWPSLRRLELSSTGLGGGPDWHERWQKARQALGPRAELMARRLRKPCPKFNGFDFIYDSA